jgi:hypothetical protein
MSDAGEFMKPFLKRGIEYLQKFIDKAPQILSYLKPVINLIGSLFFWVIDAIRGVVNFFQSWYDKIKQGNPAIVILTAAIVAIIGNIILFQTVVLAIRGALMLWAAAQWVINMAMLSNPIGLVIAGIIALAAIVGYIIYRYTGWGEAWKNLVAYLSNSWNGFKEAFNFVWLNVVDGFMSGIEFMQKGWYKFKSLWDEEGANAGLAKLNDQANERAKQIAESRGKAQEYALMAAESWNKIGLKDSGKGVKEFVTDIKGKLGLTPQPETVNTVHNNEPNGKGTGKKSNEAVATGGTKNTVINIQIGKQIEQLTVVSNSIKEGAEKIRDLIVDEMTRALAMSQAIAE